MQDRFISVGTLTTVMSQMGYTVSEGGGGLLAFHYNEEVRPIFSIWGNCKNYRFGWLIGYWM